MFSWGSNWRNEKNKISCYSPNGGDRLVSAISQTRTEQSSSCLEDTGTGRRIDNTYIVLNQIFDAPPISGRELHDLAFQPPLGCVTGNRLAASVGRWLVVGADPGREALVGHLPGNIAVDGGDELVMEVFFLDGVEDGIDAFRVLGLV